MSSEKKTNFSLNEGRGERSEIKINPTGTKRKSFESSPSKEKDEQNKEKKVAVKMQLIDTKAKGKKEPVLQKKKPSVASVFNEDSDSEQEEMPLECRMKMRNIGRDTATSSGPKSFNKSKQGFTNHSFRKFELSMKPRNSMEKQTKYDGE